MDEAYNRILLPTDGGDHASAAAEHALDLAGTYGATLHAAFVIDTGTSALRGQTRRSKPPTSR